MRALMIVFAAVLLAFPVAAEDLQTNQLEDPELQERYQSLTRELRCPMCQNENIAESGAPISNQMRREVHRRLEQGQTDEEIVAALVERFGDFVRYRPEFSARTWVLWFGPFVAIAVGIGVVIVMAIRARRRRPGTEEAPLSEEERRRVEKWLRE